MYGLLRLSVVYHRLSLNGTILGLTACGEVGVPIYDNPNKPEYYFLDGNMVLIEKSLTEGASNVGRRHFTLIHEACHQIFRMLFPEDYMGAIARRQIHYCRETTSSRVGDWEEWRTNRLASAVLMPEDMVRENMGNMDSVVFLGGREHSTVKEISEAWLGKQTISMQTDSRSRGQSESYSQNTQRLGRELMTMDELTTMSGDKCILQLRGLRPFFSPKYDLKQHPNYRYTAEADKRNSFDLSRLISRRMEKLDPDERYTVYEADVPEEADIGEDEDIFNYDDLDDPDAFV